MSTRVETIEFLTDQLSALPNIRTRSMFGEYGMYCDEKVVAFICDDTLFVKPTDAGREYLGTPDEAPAYPGSKLYFRIDGDRWEDREWLAGLIDCTAAALPAPKPKAPRKPKAASQAAPKREF
ncbi:TfoX/Sxy family protein [Leucobacter luti]|uniref:TfoX/Sxy family transcriptional regulator of competence genes n=1 Tax=Leucobacter luti TaxID=340320 RepID=A0A4R6S8M1_9MICO|nr:TfoX/Sxy family protein [Leucobacter luti]MCW2288629.1 TfoX/Sxy family transcriptional regulator of competence genes [Leucobacter luti]QYM75444.1 TfoX/Sxy family protein [Leucobacter luti]TCK45214.1 TfoX/Sxy family transcriptional regulator of competence genes [Leucobacter luti]TDP95744.1 TfoX/Sxy family transcriptional regulator of competence genes [Leucobacter luti]